LLSVSQEVLNRIASGLRLTGPEREHLFILAFGHPPETYFTLSTDITPRLQRVLEAFRSDVARAGESAETASLIGELSRQSHEFDALWRSNDVASHGEGVKRINHPQARKIELEFSTFMVEGRPDLAMLVFNPANEESRRKVDEQVRQSLSYGGASDRHYAAIHE